MSRFSYMDIFCKKVLVLEYYDGPANGIGILADGSGVDFRLLAWDEDQWQRIFAITPIPGKFFYEIWNSFEVAETPREPIWCPSGSDEKMSRRKIEYLIATVNDWIIEARDLYIIESHDLIGKSCALKLTEIEISKVRYLLESKKIMDLKSLPIIKEFSDKISKS